MRKKALGLVLAGAMVAFIALYGGGVLAQIWRNYIEWQGMGGMASTEPIGQTIFNAEYCFAQAFTPMGLQCALLILTLIGGMVLFFILKDLRMGNDDGRNFVRSKKGTYGTAKWMNNKEMKEALSVDSIKDTRSTILGKRNGRVLTLRKDSKLNKHVMVAGSTGSGKSVCYVRPFLLQCIRRGESVIVTDPKFELYEDMAQLFIDKGYEVRVFNTISPEHSDSWNCMDDLAGDTHTAQILTNIIINNTSEERPDTFWKNNEENLLKALALYVDGLDDIERSLPTLYQILTNNNARQLVQIFERLPPDHPARYAASYFIKAEPTVQAGAINGLGIRLQILQSQGVRSITAKSEIDLTLPAKRKCAYFVLLSDQDSTLNFLTSLFFRFLIIKLVRYADSTDKKKCDVPVNLCLDEFCNIGDLGGQDFARQLNTIRSRNISVSMVIQALPQLKNRYPNDIWKELLGACDTQLLLGCTDNDTAEYFSTRAGDMTVEVESTMVTKKTMSIAQTIPQYRESSGVGKRKLLTIDELMRMENEKQLVTLRGRNVLMAEKYFYKEHPLSRRMRKSSIYDYAGVGASDEPLPAANPVVSEASEESDKTTPSLYDQLINPKDF